MVEKAQPITREGLAKIEEELRHLETVRRQEVADKIRQAKELGGVDIQACSLSMDLLEIQPSDLDPLVDGIEGVTAFWLSAGDGPVVFI